MKELINAMRAKDGFVSRVPASDEEVKKAENELGLLFSEDYKDYLVTFGSASFDGHELTGINKDKRLDVVQATKFMRQFYPQFSTNFYLIEDTNLDGILICQESEGFIYMFAPNGSMKKIADSLFEYIEDMEGNDGCDKQ